MKHKNKRVSVRRTVRIRGCDVEFKEGMGQGVIYKDIVDIKASSKAGLADGLLKEDQRMLAGIVEVRHEIVKTAKVPKGDEA